MLFSALAISLSLVGSSLALPAHGHEDEPDYSTSTSCFPALGFKMPERIPETTAGWWCDMNTEYAFVGISYEVTQCQSREQLNREFKDIREHFNGRYVRLYGACDRKNFYDDVVDAAWNNGLGVHALIWFGWDDPNIWKTRRDDLFASLFSNPKAKSVTRVLQFGSEPLFDRALDPASLLVEQVKLAKEKLKPLGIPVTVSEMAWGYQSVDNGVGVMEAIDMIDAHMLPFFSRTASTGDKAWPIVSADLDYFIEKAKGKKIWFSQNGWPSVTYPGVEPNSPDAVADIENEAAYYRLLDSKCKFLKTVPGGGVGWFWHIYSDYQEPGYGIYDTNGKMKFDFAPQTHC